VIDSAVSSAVAAAAAAVVQALIDNETLTELCLSWHQRQKEQQRWREVQRQRRRAQLAGEDDEDDDPFGVAVDGGSTYSVIYGNTLRLDGGTDSTSVRRLPAQRVNTVATVVS